MVMSDVIHLFHDGKIEQSGRPVEVYTKPVTPFAAGFIGSYNILDAAAMKRMTNRYRLQAVKRVIPFIRGIRTISRGLNMMKAPGNI